MKKRFFTLAEILSVVVILGIIASITIPTTIKRGSERANKTKIRKALSVYNTAVEKMLIENNLPRSAEGLNNFNGANCQNATNYFRIAQLETPNNNCRFKAPDGLWWDITDLTNTIVAFEDKQDRQNPTKNLNWVTAGGGENKAFKFVTRFDPNGSPRANDNGFSNFTYATPASTYFSANSNIDIFYAEAIKKVNAYLNNEAYQENFLSKYSMPCTDTVKVNCTAFNDFGHSNYWTGRYTFSINNERGQIAYVPNCASPDINTCSNFSTEATLGKWVPIEKDIELWAYGCNNTFSKCSEKALKKTNNDGSSCECAGCSGQKGNWGAGWFADNSYTDEKGVKHTVAGNSCKSDNSCAMCKGNCPERDTTDHCYHL